MIKKQRKNIEQELKNAGSQEKAKILQRFFKTSPGEYGEGDVFLGITMPKQRSLARAHEHISLENIQKLIKSKYHEFRMTGFIILLNKYRKSSTENERERIIKFFLRNLKQINNWDLVDVITPGLLGDWLYAKNRDLLYKFAVSKNLWERRIAILATFHFIKRGDFKDTLKIAKVLLTDQEDLIHKAVGWMLREVGKRDLPTLLQFLDTNHREMPRTTLRYAIEKLPEVKRQHYLKLS